MRMYDLDESGNCYKVRLLAAQLGVTLELIPTLDESDREPQLGDLNAVLEVPTLVLYDGRCLPQSGAILLHLAEPTQAITADIGRSGRLLIIACSPGDWPSCVLPGAT